MTYTVYSTETGEIVDRIEADTNAACEEIADARWGTNDYAATYVTHSTTGQEFRCGSYMDGFEDE